MSDFFDRLEARSAEQREADIRVRLPIQVAHAQRKSPAYQMLLNGVEAGRVTSVAALSRLPIVRKGDLLSRQRDRQNGDVFGGFSTIGWSLSQAPESRAAKVFASPGPLYEPEASRPDYWRMARALFAAGFRGGDLVHNAFSYHFTPAGSMMESAACSLGCTVFPAGTGQTEQQVRAMSDLQPAAYVGTPSFLRILLEKADSLGLAIPALTKASVSGESLSVESQRWLAARHVSPYQSYGTADLGLIAYETSAREGLVIDEGVVVEIVRPGTSEEVPDGEIGEVVVTTLSPEYPLIRFATGDLSAILPGICPTGRTNRRLRGWLGRADQATKIRGLFVHPVQISEILRRHSEILKGRLVVKTQNARDQLTLHIEVSDHPDGLLSQVEQTIREVTKLRCEVRCIPPMTLPDDGKLIEDLRT
jgi:phenylacetate-CoA ligase